MDASAPETTEDDSTLNPTARTTIGPTGGSYIGFKHGCRKQPIRNRT
jgi:hypothetical protein